MTRRIALLTLALLCAPIVHAAQATNLAGTWSGSFVISMNGQENPDSILMTLAQKGNVLTGTVGPNADRQWPIVEGKVDGTKVTFSVTADNEMVVTFALTLTDGRLKGDAKADMNGTPLAAKVDAGRAK